MNSFQDIIDRWPSRQACADAIAGANVETVKKWHQRDSIPASWWPNLVTATADWAEPVTFELLASLTKQPLKEAS